MSTNRMRPVHPGEVLKEEFLEPLDMSATALAQALNVTPARINEIVRGERGVSPETALRLARYFNTSAEFWLNLQMTHDLRSAQIEFSRLINSQILPLSPDLGGHAAGRRR
ncbi:HigA family addiction module antitoxin [Pseudoduganella sp. UC29_106]|uniref:HigA family addiction module antitoxin n=1 Tax=Pseudoduganella sp. UC29_106 TaxID=3374553 RepID=UPI00375666DA